MKENQILLHELMALQFPDECKVWQKHDKPLCSAFSNLLKL